MTYKNTVCLIDNDVGVLRKVILVIVEIFVVGVWVGEEVVDLDFILKELILSFAVIPVQHEFYVVFHCEIKEIGWEWSLLLFTASEPTHVRGTLLP